MKWLMNLAKGKDGRTSLPPTEPKAHLGAGALSPEDKAEPCSTEAGKSGDQEEVGGDGRDIGLGGNGCVEKISGGGGGGEEDK